MYFFFFGSPEEYHFFCSIYILQNTATATLLKTNITLKDKQKMCILLGKTDHPDYSLILISNRDEVFERATETARLRFNDEVICGLDKLNGGTWLGVNVVERKFAVVLNVQSGKFVLPGSKSRGILPLLYLKNSFSSPLNNFEEFSTFYPDIQITRYFSMIFGSLKDELVTPNIISLGDDGVARSKTVTQEPNFVVTNNRLGCDTDQWPKYQIGLSELEKLNDYTGADLVEKCLSVSRKNTFPIVDMNKPYSFQETEKLVRHSIFIPKFKLHYGDQELTYGTRTTTVIMVNRKTQEIQYIEHDNTSNETHTFRFPLDRSHSSSL